MITLGVWHEEGRHHTYGPAYSWAFMLLVAGVLVIIVPFLGGFLEPVEPARPNGRWSKTRKSEAQSLPGGSALAWLPRGVGTRLL